MNDITQRRAEIWCTRLNGLMKSNGYVQETFLSEYKKKFGGGTQANVSRWLRVGYTIRKNGVAKRIGFPSYENMLNIAEFFGVTVGYLTGETDFETFEMEKACQCLDIDEETGKALKNISSGKKILFGCHLTKENRAALKYLVTSDCFPRFVIGLREYAENVYRQHHPINHLAKVEVKLKKELFELAVRCLDYQKAYDEKYGEIDDFKDNNVEPTEELLKAISLLKSAIEQNYEDEVSSEREVKLSEYELQKVYFELLRDVILEEHLPEMTIPRYGEDDSIQEDGAATDVL
ncbi:hypothetical protein B5F98_11360 [Pseudoflavonifractor sp. An44]|uniref:hypothetical protein n=1 Tax=Pseudoflavonifractor sp. An44 TaxID=1965635 RepID=UPI000B398A7A|nr:hypothetical protein [Pseudoflavonifractor sp. An44]OUN92653.1 hypothetical protein B5F98_11360 [Pseudoflavonifractor sp. An44]